MPSERPWTVQPYHPIAQLADNLWTVDGDISVPGGSHFVRKMALMNLGDGRIVIHSAIPLSEPDMNAIERWGEPAFCIVPNRFHRLDAPAFLRRYPAMKVVCPAAARHHVEKIVAVGGDYSILPRELEWRTLATRSGEAVFVSRDKERSSLIFCDALFNSAHFGGALGLMLRLIGSTGGPRVTPLAKFALGVDREKLAVQYRELAAVQGLLRLIPGHGDNIEHEAAAVLRAVADRI